MLRGMGISQLKVTVREESRENSGTKHFVAFSASLAM